MNRNDEESRYGTVHDLADGRVSVRFERALAYPVETVWAALTEQDQLDAWMPGVRFERRQGGNYEIWFGGECEGPAHVTGSVEAFEPSKLLQLGTIRWQLSETADGCLLVFTDVLVYQEGRSDAEITDSVLGGWHKYLDLLEEALAGRPVNHDQPEPDYAAREVPGRSD